jgi:hypothetical protein
MNRNREINLRYRRNQLGEQGRKTPVVIVMGVPTMAVAITLTATAARIGVAMARLTVAGIIGIPAPAITTGGTADFHL